MSDFYEQLGASVSSSEMFRLCRTDMAKAEVALALVDQLSATVKSELESSALTSVIDAAISKIQNIPVREQDDLRTFIYAVYKARNLGELNKMFGILNYSCDFNQILGQFQMLEFLFEADPSFRKSLEQKVKNQFPDNEQFVDILDLLETPPEELRNFLLEEVFKLLKGFLFQ